MLGVIPASTLTLLMAAGGLAIAAFTQGFVNLAIGKNPGPAARAGAFGKAQPTRLEAVGKLCLGTILVGILIFSAFGFLRLSPPITASAVYVGILATLILALASYWNCRVITRYMEIPLSSLLFRYSALSLIAALALIDAGEYLGALREFWSLLVPLESAELPALACAIGLIAAWPRIYGYSIEDKAHAGLLKVGQTTRDVTTVTHLNAPQIHGLLTHPSVAIDPNVMRDGGHIIRPTHDAGLPLSDCAQVHRQKVTQWPRWR